MENQSQASATERDAARPSRVPGLRRQALARVPAFFYKYHPARMQVLFASDYITELSGFDREVFTVDPARWTAHIDRGVASLKALEAFRSAVRLGQPFTVEFLFHTAHRGPRWFLAAGVPALEQDELYYYGSIIDVTEKRQAEAERNKLVAALEQADEVFIITGFSGHIQYVNTAFERTSGYTRAEALGQTPALLKSGKQSRAFYRDLWQTILGGETWRGRLVNRRKDGSLYEQWSTISPLHDEDGMISGFIAIQVDLTAQLELERRLAQAERLASVGEAIAGAAHSIKNILNTLKGSAYLLDREIAGDSSDKLHQIWDVYSRSTQRLERLTHCMLDYVRGGEPCLEPLDLNELAHEVLNACQALAEKAGLELIQATITEMPPLLGDRATIQEALLNLVGNAIEACAGGQGSRVTLRTTWLKDRRVVEVEVEDDGPGIPPEVQGRLFRPFFSTKGAKGNGLGLAMVQKTVQAHHGSIQANSVPRHTCFTIRFPLESAHPQGQR